MPFYQKALEADPEDFETNFNIGIAFYDQKQDFERAIHYLKIAVNEERNAIALFNLAVIYEEKGDRIRAKEYYQEVSHQICQL
jgi:tetratricopeptide (TPR) repeat protein